jgi:hypothetical protein
MYSALDRSENGGAPPVPKRWTSSGRWRERRDVLVSGPAGVEEGCAGHALIHPVAHVHDHSLMKLLLKVLPSSMAST